MLLQLFSFTTGKDSTHTHKKNSLDCSYFTEILIKVIDFRRHRNMF